jgi:hypothetical protein
MMIQELKSFPIATSNINQADKKNRTSLQCELQSRPLQGGVDWRRNWAIAAMAGMFTSHIQQTHTTGVAIDVTTVTRASTKSN